MYGTKWYNKRKLTDLIRDTDNHVRYRNFGIVMIMAITEINDKVNITNKNYAQQFSSIC